MKVTLVKCRIQEIEQNQVPIFARIQSISQAILRLLLKIKNSIVGVSLKFPKNDIL